MTGTPTVSNLVNGVAGTPSAMQTRADQLTTDAALKWTSKLAGNKLQVDAVLGWHRDRQDQSSINERLPNDPSSLTAETPTYQILGTDPTYANLGVLGNNRDVLADHLEHDAVAAGHAHLGHVLVPREQQRHRAREAAADLAGSSVPLLPGMTRSHRTTSTGTVAPSAAARLLCGQLVFAAGTAVEMAAKHLHEVSLPPSARTELPSRRRSTRSSSPAWPGDVRTALAELTVARWGAEQARRWWDTHAMPRRSDRSGDEPTAMPGSWRDSCRRGRGR